MWYDDLLKNCSRIRIGNNTFRLINKFKQIVQIWTQR